MTYSELKVLFKSGKSFIYKRVLKYGFTEKGMFEFTTQLTEGTFDKTLEVAEIVAIEERLKRDITQRHG